MKTKNKPKFIFVVGGVMSGVGKGITTSSIGKIIQACGFTVTAIKIDPYINVDAGTMNPTEHGEVCVLGDGDETDQDMCNYERFLGISLCRINYMTTGRVYQSVIERERNLEYKGKCVEVVPHIPEEVIRRIEYAQKNACADVTIIEIGGTIGEYQNVLFLEAARMMKIKKPNDVLFVLVSYLPIPHKVGEMKTKPTQYAARTLNSAGIQPDIIIARSERPLDQKRKEKIAQFCNIREEDVVSAPDVDSIYEVPLNFEKDHLSRVIFKKLYIKNKPSDLHEWAHFVEKIKNAKKNITIGIVGKYFETGDYVLGDAYLSVIESIKHAAYSLNIKPELKWINSNDYELYPERVSELASLDGVVVPGGFGTRGIEGNITAINFCRLNKIPYFGLCYGMQLLVIEYARNVAGIIGATSAEINTKAQNCVIDIMPEQKKKIKEKKYGGTMRLGLYPAKLLSGTIAYRAYSTREILERHRHRYEVNPDFIKRIEEAGLIFSGKSPDGKLMEISELPITQHPFFLGTQFHPEFQSSPLSPHPLFIAFCKEAFKRSKIISK